MLHGLLRLPLPGGDLYELQGVPRDVAKAQVTATLVKGSPASKWSADSLRRQPELEALRTEGVLACRCTTA